MLFLSYNPLTELFAYIFRKTVQSGVILGHTVKDVARWRFIFILKIVNRYTMYESKYMQSLKQFAVHEVFSVYVLNHCPAEPGYTLLCKQCRSRSVGFWRNQLIWICTVCHHVCEFIATIRIKYSDFLKIRGGCCFLIHSAGQWLIIKLEGLYDRFESDLRAFTHR